MRGKGSPEVAPDRSPAVPARGAGRAGFVRPWRVLGVASSARGKSTFAIEMHLMLNRIEVSPRCQQFAIKRTRRQGSTTMNTFGIEMSAQYKGIEGDQYRWEITLKRGGHSYTFGYGAGMAHKNEGKPDLKTVFYCIQSDSAAGSLSFEEFCSEFGYDEDSRNAEKTWKACQEAHAKMEELLGFADTGSLTEFEEFMQTNFDE